jgi:hypothetical protein
MTLPLSRFDRLVLYTIVALFVALALIIWRGDQVGVQAIALNPPQDAQGVSTRTQIEIRFDQLIAPVNENGLLSAQPLVEGTLRSNGEALIPVLVELIGCVVTASG